MRWTGSPPSGSRAQAAGRGPGIGRCGGVRCGGTRRAGLGMSEGTVKRHLSDAAERLRRTLAPTNPAGKAPCFGGQAVENPWGISVFAAASVGAVPTSPVSRSRSRRRARSGGGLCGRPCGGEPGTRGSAGQRHPRAATRRLDLESTLNYGAERKFLGYACTAAFATARLDKHMELRSVSECESHPHVTRPQLHGS